MPRIRKARAERIAQLQEQIKMLQASASAALRKQETRCKIIIGGTVKTAMADDAQLRELVAKHLNELVTRETDRKVIAHLL